MAGKSAARIWLFMALHEVEGFNTLRNLEQNFAIGLLRGSIAQHETLREQLTLCWTALSKSHPVEACILLIGAVSSTSPERHPCALASMKPSSWLKLWRHRWPQVC